MNTSRICPGCGKTLALNAPDGLCPECLMKAGLPTGADIGPESEAGGARAGFTAPPSEEIARLFPQLDIQGCIGQGGMGVVYRARQRELDRVVALKILPPDIGRDPSFADRFTREARALAKLSHPGIVTLYEFGRADGLFFFLMEFVDGVNLRQLQHGGRLSPREALAIVPQICDALQYAHDQGIVHRDIKPENILVDRRGRVKVADFGVAKLVGRELETVAGMEPGAAGSFASESGKIMGTPQYMAPEQREHPGEVDHRADIYSLGVVFYQMLTGELPGRRIEPPSRKVQVDVRLDEVVLRALEQEPRRRYQQASQVKTDVETIVQTPAQRSAEPKADLPRITGLSSTAFVFACLSGLIPTIFYWLAPWLVPSLTLQGRVFMSWLGVIAALVAIGMGINVRQTRLGRIAVVIGGINLSLGLLFAVAGFFSTEPPNRLEALERPGAIRGGATVPTSPLADSVPQRVLEARLRQAEAQLARLSQREAAGQVPVSEIAAARDAVAILEAQLHGDPIQVARIHLAAAQRRFKRIAALFQTGRVPKAEYEEAAAEIDIRAAELAATSAGSGPLTFGPIIERTVSGKGDTRQRFIDFDTGEVFAASEFFGPKAEPSPEETQQWLNQTGIDAVGDIRSAVSGLFGFNLVAVPVPQEEWDMPASRLDHHDALAQPGTPAVMSAKGDLPITWVIRTREGGRGLMQITGIRTDPPEVTIRYRLTQAAGGTKVGASVPTNPLIQDDRGGTSGSRGKEPTPALRAELLLAEVPADFQLTRENMNRDRLLKQRNVRLVCEPRIQTLSGREARLQIASVPPPVPGDRNQYAVPHDGITVCLLPELDGDEVRFALKAIVTSTQGRTNQGDVSMQQSSTQEVAAEGKTPLGVSTVFELGKIDDGRRRVGIISVTRVSPLASLSESDRLRALKIFNDIEDFGHEFDAAFSSTNLAAARTAVRRLLDMLTEFNAIMQGTAYQFPKALSADIAKIDQALRNGDWSHARVLARHNETYAREFKRLGTAMADLARDMNWQPPRNTDSPVP